MPRIDEIIQTLDAIAPNELAEDWDNVGLLVGDREHIADTVMTCLTLTPDVAEEAIRKNVCLIVSHHPVLFRPVQRLTTDQPEAATLLKLIQAGCAVHSPHTRYDSAPAGINQQLAKSFGLENIASLRPVSKPDEMVSEIGAGRFGDLPEPLPLSELIERVKQACNVQKLQFVGSPDKEIQRVAVACGAAAEFLPDALRENCDAFVTGEARFHYCLEARTKGISLILPGHFGSERPAMEAMALWLAERFPEMTVFSSESETDPIQFA